MSSEKVTLGDVLDTVNKGFSGVQEQIEVLKTDVAGLKKDVTGLKKDVVSIKSTMVTKDYLDDKLADLKGELIPIDRQLERRTDVLIGALHENEALSDADVGRLDGARAFPKM